jgi:hypothetical protein
MWKRFLFCLLGAFAATMGFAAAVNYAVDAQGIYHQEKLKAFYEDYARRLIASPYGLVDLPTDRPVKIDLARFADADCFVTGSSHSMQVDNATMPRLAGVCRKTVNLAVSGGTFEDFVIMAAAAAGNPGAKRLIVEVSPWALRFNADPRWTMSKDAYRAARTFLGLPPRVDGDDDARLRNLFNAESLRRNLEHAWRQGRNFAAPPPIVEANVDGSDLSDGDARFLPDGAYLYPRSRMAAMPPPIGRIGLGTYKMTRPFQDAATAAEFERAIESLTARGLIVEILLMPYHPKVLECARAYVCEALGEAEATVRGIAARHGLAVVGGYDPRPMGLTHQDFFDDTHISTVAIAKVH